MSSKHRNIEKRKYQFTEKISTQIWHEHPCPENPYLPQSAYCYGYDLLELINKRSYTDVFYLIFRGELPTLEQSDLLEKLMVALINPGPRHPATRGAMIAGVGKTDPSLILPISLSIFSGTHVGAGCIEEAMIFMSENIDKNPGILAKNLLSNSKPPSEGDWHPAPGFGSRFNGIDMLTHEFAKRLSCMLGAGPALQWGEEFATSLKPHGIGWLVTGVAAATFCDLGFHPRVGPGLFQLLCAPGLLAHGIELANKPFTAMPFPSDKDYLIEDE